jgi:hypothetical protein
MASGQNRPGQELHLAGPHRVEGWRAPARPQRRRRVAGQGRKPIAAAI